MGEYFDWVNVDKKEYISPSNFDYGAKSHESIGRGNKVLCALKELLSREWSGDHVFFMGDQNKIYADTQNETIAILYKHSEEIGYPGDGLDTVCETYKNVSGLFKEAYKQVRRDIRCYINELNNNHDNYPIINDHGVDVNDPFKGLFQRTGRDFIYTINHSKRVYYSFEKTKILFKDGTECDCFDPLPVLMRYDCEEIPHEWVGDIIGVSDSMPEGYELLNEIYLDW